MFKRVRPLVMSAQGASRTAVPAVSPRLGGTALASLLALGIASAAVAQDVAPPQLVERSEPDAPTNSFGIPLEGWVKVRYTVLAAA